MREVGERRQQLRFEHEQAQAILTFKQDEVRRLQRAQCAAKKEQEGVVQMLEAKVLELEEKCRNQSKQFSLLSRELERFRLQAETFDPDGSASVYDLDLQQLSGGAKGVETMPSFAYTPLGLGLGRQWHHELPAVGTTSTPAPQVLAFHSPPARKAECLLPRSREAFTPQGAAACSVPQLEHPNVQSCRAPPRLFITKYSYNPYDGPNENPDVELPLTAGQYVYVHGDMDNDGFYPGELPDGQRGLVPSTFVEPARQHGTLATPSPAGVQQESRLPQSPPCPGADSPNTTEVPLPGSDAFDIAFEADAEDMGADAVPYPRRLAVIKQLAKSVVIGWEPPLVPAGWGDVLSYAVLVDGEARLSVPFGLHTKAVLERLDVGLKAYRISVQSMTARGASDPLRCTLLVGRDVCSAPTQLKVEHISSTSARLSWLPSNSGLLHVVSLNGAEWQLVKAGRYSACLANLRPNQSYSVRVEARSPHSPWELPAHRQERRSATCSFTTLTAGPPKSPGDVRLDVGPSPGIAQVSWTPVSIDGTDSSEAMQVTGYAIYTDERKILEVSSPTANSVLMGPSQMEILESTHELTVRTMSPHGESSDSVPIRILPDLLSAIALGVAQTPCVKMPEGKVPALLRNPPLGAPANSTDCCPATRVDSTCKREGCAETPPSNQDQSSDLAKSQGGHQVTHPSAFKSSDQTVLIAASSVTSTSAQPLKLLRRECQDEKSRVCPLPGIQEEEEPYSDTPGEESGGAGSKPDPCETDSDEELLESLIKFPFQAPGSKQLCSIAEVTEEEEDTEEQVQVDRPRSPEILQLTSWLGEAVTTTTVTSLPKEHQQIESRQGMSCEAEGCDPLAGEGTAWDPKVSHASPKSVHCDCGDQCCERPCWKEDQRGCGHTPQATSKPQRRVHYSDIVESISYQEEEFESDCSADAPAREVQRTPARVQRSYHLQGSRKAGDRLRREVLQKTLLWAGRRSPGSKTVVRTRVPVGSGMEISLEYGTEDDDDSLLGDPADIVEQMSSEWWLEGGRPLQAQGSGGRSNDPDMDVCGVKGLRVLGNVALDPGPANTQQRHHRRGRTEAPVPEGSYEQKAGHHARDHDKPYHLRAKLEPERRSHSSRDGQERETYGNGGKSATAAGCAPKGLRRQSQRRAQSRSRQLKGARIFAALFPYDPAVMSPNPDMAQEELPFVEGQVIQVYGDKDVDGFYYGEYNGRFGYVPCNMVSEIQVEDEEARCQLLQRGVLPVEVPLEKADQRGSAAGAKERVARKMVAVFDYDPRESSPNSDIEAEITFSAGDVIYVFGGVDDDGFFYGELNGQRGLVPSNFLQAMPDIEDEGHKETGQVHLRASAGAGSPGPHLKRSLLHHAQQVAALLRSLGAPCPEPSSRPIVHAPLRTWVLV